MMRVTGVRQWGMDKGPNVDLGIRVIGLNFRVFYSPPGNYLQDHEPADPGPSH